MEDKLNKYQKKNGEKLNNELKILLRNVTGVALRHKNYQTYVHNIM